MILSVKGDGFLFSQFQSNPTSSKVIFALTPCHNLLQVHGKCANPYSEWLWIFHLHVGLNGWVDTVGYPFQLQWQDTGMICTIWVLFQHNLPVPLWLSSLCFCPLLMSRRNEHWCKREALQCNDQAPFLLNEKLLSDPRGLRVQSVQVCQPFYLENSSIPAPR